jgi:hypothetical protein
LFDCSLEFLGRREGHNTNEIMLLLGLLHKLDVFPFKQICVVHHYDVCPSCHLLAKDIEILLMDLAG